MKKLIIMACTMAMMMVAPIAANADYTYVCSGCFIGGPTGAFQLSDGTGNYGKCTDSTAQTEIMNKASNYCKGSYVAFSYTSRNTNHAGDRDDPYIYTGCAFDSCACGYDSYVSSDDPTQCIKCSTVPDWDGAVASVNKGSAHFVRACMQCLTAPQSDAQIRVDRGSGSQPACYCPDNAAYCDPVNAFCDIGYYRTYNSSTKRYECTACEEGATTGKTGATSHTECCYPSGTDNPFYDSTGTYYYKGKCCYTN